MSKGRNELLDDVFGNSIFNTVEVSHILNNPCNANLEKSITRFCPVAS